MQKIMTYVVVSFVLFCVSIYFMLKIGSKKKKTKKPQVKKNIEEKSKTEDNVSKNDELLEKAVDEGFESIAEQNDAKTSEIKKNKPVKKSKNKPEISYVYEKTEKKIKEEHQEYEPSISEDEILSKMQFVKSSNTVSKLVKFSTLEPETQEALVKEESEIDNLAEEEKKVETKYFDKSRRLSKCIECGSFDDMFCSHISEDYLNINADRHLKLGDNFTEKLYSRAAGTIANSLAKVEEVPREKSSAEGLTKNESVKSWIENKKREELAKLTIASDDEPDIYVVVKKDELNLSSKNLLVVDSIMNRKRLKRK